MINENPIHADYSALSVKIETNPKALKFKVNDRVLITKKNLKDTKNWTREMFVIDYVSRTNSWTYKIQDLNGEEIIGNFY